MGMCRIIKEIIRVRREKERARQREVAEWLQHKSQIALRICSHLGCNVQSHAGRIAGPLSGEEDAVGRRGHGHLRGRWAGAERSCWSVYTLSLEKNSIIELENVYYKPPLKQTKNPNLWVPISYGLKCNANQIIYNKEHFQKWFMQHQNKELKKNPTPHNCSSRKFVNAISDIHMFPNISVFCII